LGEILPFAIVVTISPVNIIAAILLLFSKRPLVNAANYLVGFVVGVAAFLSLVTVLAGLLNLSAGSDRARWASVLLLVLGLLLLVAGIQKLRHRPGPDDDVQKPKWMDGIEDFSSAKSLLVGIAVGFFNPKNIAVGVAAAITIASAQLSVGDQVILIAMYVVIASLGVAAPIIVVLVLGDRSTAVLDSWRSWLNRNNAAVMAVIYLVFGVVLIGKGIGGV
jgi:threonine/homoserine/homoserine lactone efflux protein